MRDLRANGLREPLGLPLGDVRLTWRDPADVPVRLTVEDAGRVVTVVQVEPGEIAIKISGEILASMTRYEWVARGPSGEEFARGAFEMGLATSDWSASWIRRGPIPLSGEDGEPLPRPADRLPRTWRTMYSSPPTRFRRAFAIQGELTRARLAVSARGIHDVRINGQRVTDDELAPGWSDYTTSIEYRVHDVAPLLVRGENVLSATVAEGWWAGYLGYDTRRPSRLYGEQPEFIAQLDLVVEGRSVRIATDRSWQTGEGHIRVADLLMGEYHDAAFRTDWWELAGFDASGWSAAAETGHAGPDLVGIQAPPMRVTEERSVTTIAVDGPAQLFDVGQNLVGRLRVELRNQPEGTVVTIRHGEMLDEGGRLYTDNLRSAEARDVVVCSGEPVEVFEPRFTLHGFRYVEILGAVGRIDDEDVTALVVHSDLEIAGSFQSGNELVTLLDSNIRWGMRGNYVGIPTDCPQRDERLGWTADTQVFLGTAACHFDVETILTRWLSALYSAQDERGCVPDVAPRVPHNTQFDEAAPGWGDAAVIVPWGLYREYGDIELLRRHYPAMRAWVEWVHRENGGGLWRRALGSNYGDWLSVDEHTPHALVAAAHQIHSIDLVARAAAALGMGEEERLGKRASHLRALFAEEFVAPDGLLRGDTQSAYLFALAWRLVSGADRERAAKRLIAKIEERGNRLTSGFLGIGLLCPVLTTLGRGDLATRLVLQTDYPSWGYSIEQGATTIWERWDGWTRHAGFQDVRMNSFNHYSLGSVGEWLYRAVAGIDQTDASVGYRHLHVRPHLDPVFAPVHSTRRTTYGDVEVDWDVDAAGIARVRVSVPEGSDAVVELPGLRDLVGAGTHEWRVATRSG